MPGWIVAAGIVVTITASSRAAWVSEVWLSAQPGRDIHDQIVQIPALIEVSGLAGIANPELVIIDAGDSLIRYGRVKQIFSLTGSANVRLVHEGLFPPTLGVSGQSATADILALADNETFDLAGSRAAVLFDQPTGLSVVGGNINSLNDLDPVDVVTFGSPGQTRVHADFVDRPVIDVSDIAVVTRPNQPEGPDPWPNLFFTRTPSLNIVIPTINGNYQLNPARFNRRWQPLPEPSAGLCLALFLLALSGRSQRRRPTRGGQIVRSGVSLGGDR